MGDGSPTAYLLWAILSSLFFIFLLSHLWFYDHFRSLLSTGQQPGAFKRVMTYSYLGTVPLLMVFSIGMTVLKFKAGSIITHDGRIIPKPLFLWEEDHKHILLFLYFVISIAWGLEIVTHLEELTFWLFLLHQGQTSRDWYESWEFRFWYVGSTVAVLGMPIVTLITRRELLTCMSHIFTVGASASTATTLCFLYVLWRFPSFLKLVKAEGADPEVVVRLATSYQLNVVRVIFRFLFTLPLLALNVDVLSGSFRIVRSLFGVDFCLLCGGIGCFVSSAITLFIFFPRSITRESGYKPTQTAQQRSSFAAGTMPGTVEDPDSKPTSPRTPAFHHAHTMPSLENGDVPASPSAAAAESLALMYRSSSLPPGSRVSHAPRPRGASFSTSNTKVATVAETSGHPQSDWEDAPDYSPMGHIGPQRTRRRENRPGRRGPLLSHDVLLESAEDPAGAPVDAGAAIAAERRARVRLAVHPYAMQYRSPIDLVEPVDLGMGDSLDGVTVVSRYH